MVGLLKDRILLETPSESVMAIVPFVRSWVERYVGGFYTRVVFHGREVCNFWYGAEVPI